MSGLQQKYRLPIHKCCVGLLIMIMLQCSKHLPGLPTLYKPGCTYKVACRHKCLLKVVPSAWHCRVYTLESTQACVCLTGSNCLCISVFCGMWRQDNTAVCIPVSVWLGYTVECAEHLPAKDQHDSATLVFARCGDSTHDSALRYLVSAADPKAP